jgi:hypothetical protein
MEFSLHCSCGRRVRVTEVSAGATAPCICGRAIPVPKLSELRRRAGVSTRDLSPELVIEQYLASGSFPCDNLCVVCGAKTANRTSAAVECEKIFLKDGMNSGIAFFSLLLGIFAHHLPHRVLVGDEVEQHGRDLTYVVPLAACEHCLTRLYPPEELKQALRRVTLYRQLLDKYPDAMVRLVNQ